MTAEDLPPENAATRLLDACRDGDLSAALSQLETSATLAAPGLERSWQGTAEIQQACARATALFPDLSFRAHTRHVGRGVVIDEGRATGTQTGGEDPSGLALSLPVRVTVRHDAAGIHELDVAFPAHLVWQALGLPVDHYAVAAAEIQSAFMVPVGAGLTTYKLAESVTTERPSGAHGARWAGSRKGRVRTAVPLWLMVVAVVFAVVLVIGGIVALVGGNQDTTPSASPTTSQSPRPTKASEPTPKQSPTNSPSAPSPTPPHPTRKPNVTLKSDLAFGYDSARLSQAARDAIRLVARQARAAGLEGDIFVDGYTDNLGSAAHGMKLSQQRANAVAAVLRDLLDGQPLRVIATGHGEADPIASNATEAGRKQNRRVTITLPRP